MTDVPNDRRTHDEVQEIYDSLRWRNPHRTTVDLWTEALSLHAVRFETNVRPPAASED